MKTLRTALIIAGLCHFVTAAIHAQDVDSAPPVVVKAVPEAGSKEVAPGVVEIRITFSKPMTDQSWSWSSAWKDSVPDAIGKPRYETDGKTCVLKAKLEALARSTRRSKSFLAAEAIAAYVELNEWQIGEITAGIQELDSGEALSEKQAEERYNRLMQPR